MEMGLDYMSYQKSIFLLIGFLIIRKRRRGEAARTGSIREGWGGEITRERGIRKAIGGIRIYNVMGEDGPRMVIGKRRRVTISRCRSKRVESKETTSHPKESSMWAERFWEKWVLRIIMTLSAFLDDLIQLKGVNNSSSDNAHDNKGENRGGITQDQILLPFQMQAFLIRPLPEKQDWRKDYTCQESHFSCPDQIGIQIINLLRGLTGFLQLIFSNQIRVFMFLMSEIPPVQGHSKKDISAKRQGRVTCFQTDDKRWNHKKDRYKGPLVSVKINGFISGLFFHLHTSMHHLYSFIKTFVKHSLSWVLGEKSYKVGTLITEGKKGGL